MVGAARSRHVGSGRSSTTRADLSAQMAAGQGGGRAKGGVLLLVGVGLPFPSSTRKREGGRKEREREKERGATPLLPSPIRTPKGRERVACLGHHSLSQLRPMWPISSPGGFRQPSDTPVLSETSPEHFRCPNIVVQYINLYLSTISRLLVMSVISSATPNNLRSPKHIIHNTNHHRTLSVRTLWVRELCRHDRDTSSVNNQ